MSDDELRPWGEDAPRAWRALGDARADLGPPALPAAVRAQGRREVIAATSPRSPVRGLVAIVVAVAAVVALAVWARPTGTPDAPPAQLEVRPDPEHDAGPPSDDAPVPPQPRADLPQALVMGNGCGIDVALELTPVGSDVASVFLVLREHPGREEHVTLDCEGQVIAEIDPRLFASAPARAELPIELLPPTTRCGASYTVAVCARLRDGRIAVGGIQHQEGEPASARGEWPHRTDDRDWGRHPPGMVLTPSGAAAPADLTRGHRVVTVLDAARWAEADSSVPPVHAASIARLDVTPPPGVTELRLATGRVAVLSSRTEVWVASRDGLRAARDVSVGDRVVDASGARVPVTEVVHHPREQAPLELDLRDAEYLFVDDVLVHDAGPPGPRPAAEAAYDPLADPGLQSAIRVVPLPAGECSLPVDVEVRELPPGARSLVIAYQRHRGPGGARRPIDCAVASIGAELSGALLSLLPERERGVRVVGVELPAWDETFHDWHPSEPEQRPPVVPACDAEYDVIVCARDASGALVPVGSGPWAQTGVWARTGPACFAEGTLIAGAAGPRPIQSLRRGERLVTVDPATGEARQVVVEALVDRGVREIVELVLDDGTVLRVTAEHPLYDARAERFRAAGELGAGDVLVGSGGRALVVRERIERGARARVYDVSVDGAHTYLAGGVLAHNY